MCIVFLYFCTMWKLSWIPFERYRYEEKRWRIGRDMAFRSWDAPVILLRKLPERCKTRPSKLRCNSNFGPFVSKIGTRTLAYYASPNQKMSCSLDNMWQSYLRYGTVSLPNLTTNLYIIFQIFCMPYQGLSNGHLSLHSKYSPITGVILITGPWDTGVLDMYTR